jgi:Pyruvate/2-oxoacid:ferredoxin oxidoreductase delta subunit
MIVVTLLDNKSFLRMNLFRLFAINSIDAMEFYYFMGEKAQIPVIGKAVNKLMSAYYKYVHTSAVKLPLKDIEEVINQASHISVGPCPCRVIFDKNGCDAPIYTCLKINHFSKFTSKLQELASRLHKERGLKVENEKSMVLTKEEAIDLMRNARKYDLVFSLESCIQPYQNNICACCPDCCIELNMRYKFGLDVCPGGPYIPTFNHESCTGCGQCEKRCPVQAIVLSDKKPSVDLKVCLGCGICEEICASSSFSMTAESSRIPQAAEPGMLKLMFVFFLSLLVFLIFTGYNLGKKSDNIKYFLAKPRKSDVIQ